MKFGLDQSDDQGNRAGRVSPPISGELARISHACRKTFILCLALAHDKRDKPSSEGRNTIKAGIKRSLLVDCVSLTAVWARAMSRLGFLAANFNLSS
jgi:hypothetical protein